MPQNFIGRDRGQAMLLPPDMTDLVPEDHLVWSLLGPVERMNLSAFDGVHRSSGHGSAAHEPSMMVADRSRERSSRRGIVSAALTRTSAPPRIRN